MKTYCLGFIFQADRLLLIRKNRPEWQRGRYNGVGGHVEEGETPLDAMIRETREESGFSIPTAHWRPVCAMKFNDCIVYVFSAQWSFWMTPHSPTDETLQEVDRIFLPPDCLPNLHWLVPMAWNRLTVDTDSPSPLISFVR